MVSSDRLKEIAKPHLTTLNKDTGVDWTIQTGASLVVAWCDTANPPTNDELFRKFCAALIKEIDAEEAKEDDHDEESVGKWNDAHGTDPDGAVIVVYDTTTFSTDEEALAQAATLQGPA